MFPRHFSLCRRNRGGRNWGWGQVGCSGGANEDSRIRCWEAAIPEGQNTVSRRYILEMRDARTRMFGKSVVRVD